MQTRYSASSSTATRKALAALRRQLRLEEQSGSLSPETLARLYTVFFSAIAAQRLYEQMSDLLGYASRYESRLDQQIERIAQTAVPR
ncbi:MAG: hypothetical protein ACP5G7_04830 [Anaerolineae bacterium]